MHTFYVTHQYPNKFLEYDDKDALAVYATKTGFPVLRDRFGYLNQFSAWNMYSVFDTFPISTSTKTLEEIMDNQAEYIFNKLKIENSDCYMFLSGGVDSTAMVIAMLKAADTDLSKLHIIYTKETVLENPVFIDELNAVNIDKQLIESHLLDEVQVQCLNKGYVLVGWCADQLFGSIVNQLYPDEFHKDWRLWVEISDAIEQFEDSFKHYNLPIKTFGELAWFMNFSCKYNVVKNSDVLYSGNITNKMISFYDSKDFQDWSVSNFDVLHKYEQQDTIHYKKVLKDYIYKFNKDSDYLKNKGKIGSWNAAISVNKPDKIMLYLCIMENPDTACYYRYTKLVSSKQIYDVKRNIMRNHLRKYRKKD
jgi:hypothetical protein